MEKPNVSFFTKEPTTIKPLSDMDLVINQLKEKLKIIKKTN